MRRRGFVIGAAAALIFCTMPAYAYAALPTLTQVWQTLACLLVFVILIETLVFKFRGFLFWWSLKWNAIANAVSTIIGIPLTWLAYLLIEVWGAGWSDYSGAANRQDFYTLVINIVGAILKTLWIGPMDGNIRILAEAITALILLVPFFFVSWRIETFIVRRFNAERDRRSISRASLVANLASYGLLALLPLAALIGPEWFQAR
jgi:hypothetical protein